MPGCLTGCLAAWLAGWLAGWLPDFLASWLLGWLTGWVATLIPFSTRLFVLCQAKMPKQIQQTMMTERPSRIQNCFWCATLQKHRFSGKRDLGGLRLRWVGPGWLSLVPGLGDQTRGRPSPEWSRTGPAGKMSFLENTSKPKCKTQLEPWIADAALIRNRNTMVKIFGLLQGPSLFVYFQT